MDFNKLHEIDEQLTTSEVAALKFLCMDELGRKRLEAMKDAKDLFVRLSEQDFFQNSLFLPDLLYTIGRCDLLSILDTNKTDLSKSLQNQKSGVSAYRKMLYELSEDITNENLHNIKFFLGSLPKAKMASASFLDVLAEMEKMEMLGENNLDELENILLKCSKELAYKVQQFKNRNGTRQLRMAEQDKEVSYSQLVPPEEEFRSFTIHSPVAETDPSFSTASLSRSEISVVADSPMRPVSETIQTNTLNVPGDDCYPMTQRPLGHCLIINNYSFEKTKFLNREGTDVDKDSLTEVFQRMHFSVEERRDLCSSKILNAMKEFSEKDHSKMDAFVCCILSHGEKGTVYGVDGKRVRIREFPQMFASCRSLVGKPKLFFIQACQGSNNHCGTWRQDGNEEEKYDHDAEKADLSQVPIEADFLIGMATVESYRSYRHTKKGSVFIQELCNQLKIGCPKKEDILTILTRVNYNVSLQVLMGYKQMPEPRYTLTKKLVLPWSEL